MRLASCDMHSCTQQKEGSKAYSVIPNFIANSRARATHDNRGNDKLELPLVLPTNPTTTVRLVNFGYDHYQEEKKADEGLNMHVLTSKTDKRVVPLFQEEDNQQRVLIGLMVDKLREHLYRHVGHLGKKKIDTLVVNYVATLVCTHFFNLLYL
ncbi:Gamma-secretase-activating protein [Acipenser ruthenus]|uniref:Gamma-secretase-activating protein n=1 Tax=Acipenser ruthenus TaxID=7906 RepID=A0A444UAX1_ACIRT|nr:Gamma-secretase-activating protein [Acipenser ruthenus]